MTGVTGAPIPISYLSPLPKIISVPILSHVSASQRPPVLCTPFSGSSIPGTSPLPAHGAARLRSSRSAGAAVGRCRLAPVPAVPSVLVLVPEPGGAACDPCGADSGGAGRTSEGIPPSLPWGACCACHLLSNEFWVQGPTLRTAGTGDRSSSGSNS